MASTRRGSRRGPARRPGAGRGSAGRELRASIIAAHPGLHATDFGSKPVGYEGYDYIQQGINPGADTRDNLFLAAGYIPEFGSKSEITLAEDEFLVIYGVNHFATSKAAYASFNVYASDKAKLSIGQVFHAEYANTAATYMASGGSAVSKLYAYKVSRDCSGEPSCVTLRVDDCPKLTITDNTVLGFFFRMYLEPANRGRTRDAGNRIRPCNQVFPAAVAIERSRVVAPSGPA